jgi:DUF917 family protein
MARIALDKQGVEYAVYGGAVLGGGGGGWIEDGLKAGRLAIEVGQLELWTADELDDDDWVVTVALVGAPAAEERCVTPAHYLKALELLRRQLDKPIAGIITNEIGAAGAVNGWFQSVVSGLPIVDCPCNGRAHPTGVMGSLNLSDLPGYVSRQAAVGGAPGRYLEVSVAGTVERAATMIRKASVEAGGLLAVARNPVALGHAKRNGAPGAIRKAIAVGKALRRRQGEAAIAAAVDELGGRVIATGAVTAFSLETAGGFDVGTVAIGDAYELTFWNEYMTLEKDGERLATFPDLIMTLEGRTARPVVSAEIAKGQEICAIAVPREKLILSTTMRNERLLKPIEDIVHKPILSFLASGEAGSQ